MANLERIVGWVFLASVFVFGLICRVSCDAEGDALIALKTNFTDPKNELQSWDPNQHHCTWNHVTCNYQNSVTRVDLGNFSLSGQLVPQLGQLPNLQYLELFSNNITGRIPEELGNLTNLVSLDLYLNSLIGPIPPTLGKLSQLRFLRLNNNSLSGAIPLLLTTIFSLQVLDLSNNQLTGDIPINGSFSLFSPICFANNRLNQPPIPTTPTAASSGSRAMKAIAGAALLFAAPAIALALCRRRKPQDHFFDLKNIQKFIRDSLKGFLFMNYKLQQIILAIKTFWVEVDLVRFIKDA